jgi:hypothetical protein
MPVGILASGVLVVRVCVLRRGNLVVNGGVSWLMRLVVWLCGIRPGWFRWRWRFRSWIRRRLVVWLGLRRRFRRLWVVGLRLLVGWLVTLLRLVLAVVWPVVFLSFRRLWAARCRRCLGRLRGVRLGVSVCSVVLGVALGVRVVACGV